MTARRARYWHVRWLWNTEEPIPGPTPKRQGSRKEYEARWVALATRDAGRTVRTARVVGERAPTPAEATRLVQRQYREVIGGRMRVRRMTVRRIGGARE